jgi:Coenzyme PQQ synthesis protein D (PqqD)
MLQNANTGNGDLLNASDDLFIRARAVVSRGSSGEILAVPVRAKAGNLGTIYRFNGVESLIFQLLESPKGLTDLTAAVAREFAQGSEQAGKKVEQFIREMSAAGLVEVCQPGAIIAAESSRARAEFQAASSR